MLGTFLSLSITTLWETESKAFEKSKDRTLTKLECPSSHSSKSADYRIGQSQFHNPS